MASAVEPGSRNVPAKSGGGNGRPPKTANGTGPSGGGKEPINYRSPGAAKPSGGLFSIWKKGQGFWTRLGTGVAAAGLILLTSNFIFAQISAPLRDKPAILYAIVAGFAVLGAGLVWYFMNRPKNADFLIATDSEMKKVNWTTQKELIGSTKVVILFMFAIAAMLFVVDILFGYFFWFLHVLRNPPV